MPGRYAVFVRQEHLERLSRLRAMLSAEGYSAAVIIASEHLYYFGGYDSWVGVNSPQAMILTARDDPPTLVLRDVDLPLALETTWLDDIRTYSLVLDDFPGLVAEILAEKSAKSGKIACELQSYAVPYALGQALGTALEPARMEDATRQIGLLRLQKSPTEIQLLKRAAEYAETGLVAFRNAVREGVAEIEIAAELEGAMRRAGSDYPAIPTELSSGSRSAGGHATPRVRAIGPGDLIHAEFAGVAERYHAVAIQTVSCGKASGEAKELYAAALQSLHAGIASVRPGVCVEAVEEASLAPLRAAGLDQAAQMRFGYGIGIAYPPIWLEALQIARGFCETLKPGMAFVLHACLQLPEEGLGAIQGGTYLLEEGGLTMLSGAGAAELKEL